MSITLKVSPGGVPAGNYVAKFVNVENISNSYGPGLSPGNSKLPAALMLDSGPADARATGQPPRTCVGKSWLV